MDREKRCSKASASRQEQEGSAGVSHGRNVSGKANADDYVCKSSSFAKEKALKTTLPARGPLRGLNPNNILSAPSTQVSIELSDDDDDDENARKSNARNSHSTRASRYGKAAANYDMKYHPMDEVTRPKRTANRRSGSRSVSTSFKREAEPGTSDETEPSLAKDSDATDEEDYEVESDSGAPVAVQRAPDPRSSRHSVRAEAQKVVNYSRKHHPQDYGVPGFSRKTTQSRREPAGLVSVSKRLFDHKRTGDDRDGDDGDDDDEPQEQDKSPSRPRKMLRSLSSSSPTAIRAKARSSKSKRKPGKAVELPITRSDEVNGLVENAMRGLQASDTPVWNMQIDDDSAVADNEESHAIDTSDDHFHAVESRGNGTAEVESHASERAEGASAAATPPTTRAKQATTPNSGCRLAIVKPYLATGYETVTLDPRTLARSSKQQVLTIADASSEVCTPLSLHIQHQCSSSPDIAGGSVMSAKTTRASILTSSMSHDLAAQIGGSTGGSENAPGGHDVMSSPTMAGSRAGGSDGTISSSSTMLAATLPYNQATLEEARSEFEDQLDVTELQRHEHGHPPEQHASESMYVNLPVSQKERSDEEQLPSHSSQLVQRIEESGSVGTGVASSLGIREPQSDGERDDLLAQPMNSEDRVLSAMLSSGDMHVQ